MPKIKKAAIRLRLYRQARGRCHWCGCVTVLPDSLPKREDGHLRKPYPPNMATIDHLRSRFDPRRTEIPMRGEVRLVLACRVCNNTRENNTIPVEQRRARTESGRGRMRARSVGS